MLTSMRGHQLQKIRLQHGMSRAHVAERLGIPWSVYRRIELDDCEVPVELDLEGAFVDSHSGSPSASALRNLRSVIVDAMERA